MNGHQADRYIPRSSSGRGINCNIFQDQKKLEDLKVLRRSPDHFNNVKIGQGQLLLIIKHILFYHGVAAALVK